MLRIVFLLIACGMSSTCLADFKIKQVIRMPDGSTIERIVIRKTRPMARIALNRMSRAQEWAQREADYLADNRMSGHPMGCAPGCTFSGTGMTSNVNTPTEQVPSCRPSYSMQLIAVGVARRPWGVYVSRHWR